jgi:hypothetical protein
MSPAQPESRIDVWAGRINRLPRLARVFLSLLITLEYTGLLWLLAVLVFDIDVFATDPDTTWPLLLVLGVGLVVYGVGWWAMVGFDWDPNRPWQAERPAVLFVAAGVLALILLVALVLFGLAFGYVL